MSELKQARDEFEDYVGWKPPRWKLGCNGETYYDPAIENRWQDFLQGWNRRTQPEATKPAQDLGAAKDAELFDLARACLGVDLPFDAIKRFSAALASSADALVAGDSEAVRDVKRLHAQVSIARSCLYAITKTLDDHELREAAQNALDQIDAARQSAANKDAAIQAQKDGHD